MVIPEESELETSLGLIDPEVDSDWDGGYHNGVQMTYNEWRECSKKRRGKPGRPKKVKRGPKRVETEPEKDKIISKQAWCGFYFQRRAFVSEDESMIEPKPESHPSGPG